MPSRRPRALPHPLRRTANVAGETFHIDRSVASIPTPRVWRIGLLGALGISAGILLVGLVSVPMAMALGAVGVLALIVWLGLGLLVLPAITGAARPDELALDAGGLAWNGQRVAWHEIRAIQMAPYPFADRSYVYCLELRLADATILRVAQDIPPPAIAAVEAAVSRRWRAAPPAGRGYDADLAALDALVGHRRDTS